ncbi:uncharacterized protein LOC128742973 isoform X2 [Sabethes cyaneus]|uniref:uncharacterized protein LOC128742973 isoform X2 n=1 Tax=Sabethes cyaneus TaxID=53552 RepID=UPI00237D67F3|nr:uncharacterized protein LOC128742973 isoform X2 [Sabethes cyaneus]
MSEHDISKMKVADLKKELKNRGLSTLGNKNELIDRLQTALIGGDPLEDTANSEDLLEDDELNDDILEDEEEKLQDGITEEEHILKSPTPSEASKSESPEQQRPQESSEKKPESQKDTKADHLIPQKKVALKRNISISVATPVTSSADVEGSKDDTADKKEVDNKPDQVATGEPEKKIIKLNQMTAQERLEMRAKKFGPQAVTTDVSSNSKLQARAARFGIGGTSSTASTSNGSNSNLVSLDALKKRAERFGANVSDKLTKLEQEEKLQKRQERFGQAAETKLTATGKVAITASSSTSTDYSERARLRLQRFKNTV